MYLELFTYYVMHGQVRRVTLKLFNWVLLCPGTPYLTYCSCRKSGCPLSVSYCPPSTLNSRLTPCHYLFADDLSFVYCLLSTVNWLLFVTHYPLLYETLTYSIIISMLAGAYRPLCLSDLLTDYLLKLSDK